MAIWGPIIGSVLGSAVSGMFSKSSAKDQMDFQEEMSNTAYQRQVKDMIAAGINPMLSAKLGGASTPAGAGYSVPDFSQSISSGISAVKTRAEIDQVKAQTEVAQSQARLNDVAAVKAQAETEATLANAQTTAFHLERLETLRDEFDLFLAEGREVQAREARAVYERFMASRDWNTVHYLDEFARDKGYRNFDEAVGVQKFRDQLQAYLRSSLQVPYERARSGFFETPEGKAMAPFISNSGSALDPVAAGASLIGKGLGGLGKMLK